MEPAEAKTGLTKRFDEGEVVGIDTKSKTITAEGDDHSSRIFTVTAATEIERRRSGPDGGP